MHGYGMCVWIPLPVARLGLCCIVNLFLLPDVLFVVIKRLDLLFGAGLKHSRVGLFAPGERERERRRQSIIM